MVLHLGTLLWRGIYIGILFLNFVGKCSIYLSFCLSTFGVNCTFSLRGNIDSENHATFSRNCAKKIHRRSKSFEWSMQDRRVGGKQRLCRLGKQSVCSFVNISRPHIATAWQILQSIDADQYWQKNYYVFTEVALGNLRSRSTCFDLCLECFSFSHYTVGLILHKLFGSRYTIPYHLTHGSGTVLTLILYSASWRGLVKHMLLQASSKQPPRSVPRRGVVDAITYSTLMFTTGTLLWASRSFCELLPLHYVTLQKELLAGWP